MHVRSQISVALVLLALPGFALAEETAQQVVAYPGEATAYCIAVDSNQDVWVTHGYDGYVDKIQSNQTTPDGSQLVSTRMTIAPLPTPTLGIAIDSADNVYFAAGNFLYKRDPTLCNPPADPDLPPCLKKVVKPGPHGLKSAWPVVVDNADNVYVAGSQFDSGGLLDSVWKVTPLGVVTTIHTWWRAPGAYAHWDLAVDGSGNVFVSEYGGGASAKVLRIPALGGPVVVIQPNVEFIDGIEVDSLGNLWVAGRSVVKVTPEGPSDWSDWSITDRTPPGYSDASNTWMGPGDELYITGVSHGKVFEINDGTPPEYTLLLDDDDSMGPPIHQYGLDVFGDSRGYLYLANEQVTSEPASDADVWRICENLDSDILCDTQDNCTEVDNPSQHDPDHDGYGSRCDGDLDQNGVSGLSDRGIFLACLGKTVEPGAGPAHDPTCAESDIDGNGAVGISDYGVFNSFFGLAAGPTGLDCATSPPTDGSCP
jgi:hypothetical protein